MNFLRDEVVDVGVANTVINEVVVNVLAFEAFLGLSMGEPALKAVDAVLVPSLPVHARPRLVFRRVYYRHLLLQVVVFVICIRARVRILFQDFLVARV